MANTGKLGEGQVSLLQAVFDHFNETGEWPNSIALNVKLREMGDLWDNAQAIGFAYIEAQQHGEQCQTKLTVLGMSLCEGSDRILGIFLNAVKFSVNKYIANYGNPKLSGIELFTGLKIEHENLRRLILILKNEHRFSGSHNNANDPYSFDMTLSKDILKFEKINDLEDYINIAYPWLNTQNELVGEEKYDPWKYIPFHANTGFSVGINHGPTLSISELLRLLHHVICENCHELFESSHFSEAVERGFRVVRDRLRKLTSHETGSEAFGKGKLHIRGAAAAHVDQDFNDAAKFLCMAIDRFRNEASHTSDSRINDPGRAYEYLMLCSLAMNLLEDAEILNKENE